MRLIDWIPGGYHALALVLLAGLSAGGAWQAQDWRYSGKLAQQEAKAAEKHRQHMAVVVDQLEQQKAQRGALEARLKTNDETHYKALTDAHDTQKRLRDRLATADVRLSVLLASGDRPGGGGPVSAATGAGGVVHGATRAELDPAHAQRIIGITADGDDGLRALAACQAYARTVSRGGQATAPP